MPKATKQQTDLELLFEERQAGVMPWTRTPFVRGLAVPGPDDEIEELQPGELRVKAPEEVPWIDLLLEIAMTTAFASLTDGTPILQVKAALGYVCYFFFVWWIWASQVAYNMRFRQADVLHRIWVFAQLIVFGVLAAFTSDFDITSGTSQDPDEALADSLFAQAGNNQSVQTAAHFRSTHLPVANSKGLSLAMSLSRLLLLLQYAVVFYHAKRLRVTKTSLLVHMIPLLFSSLCYLAVFLSLNKVPDGSAPSHAVEILKLVLWFLPIIVEIISHFVALSLPGFVKYSTESVYARSGTVFLIILGAGLDKITSGFRLIVGNSGLGSDGIPIFISAAVIFIGFFSLYFGTPGSTRKSGRGRTLAWFFSHFFFLAALIVALQGIATSIAFSNVDAALGNAFGAVLPVVDFINDNPQVNMTAADFKPSAEKFDNLGLSFQDFVDVMNSNIDESIQTNDSDIVLGGLLQYEVSVFSYLLEHLDAKPDENSLLAAKLSLYTDPDNQSNTTEVNLDNFIDIYSQIIRDRGSSALWFYPACGLTILSLVMISLIKGLPRDKWEWAVIAARSFIGSGLCMLLPLNIGQSKPIFDSQYDLSGAKIWFLAEGDKRLLLIIMAVIMAALLIIEISLAHASRRMAIRRQRGAEFDPEKRTATIETLGYNQYSGISETNLDARVGKI